MSKKLMKSPRAAVGHFAVLFLALIVVAIIGQWSTGVYGSDLSQWPDEGAHYINGLLIHDYVVDGLPGSPLTYALQYYVHYPRVTIGHWPPLYYMVQALFYFVTGPSIQAALLLQAVFGAGVATVVGWVISRFAGWIVGALAGITTLAAPQIFIGMQEVMLDVPIAFLTCLAMLAWARFLLDGTWPWSVAFGLTAAGAIMVKGNGILLALVPPLSVALIGRLRLLWNWRFWVPALIAGVLTVPWYLITYKITAGGFSYPWGREYIVMAIPAYSSMLLNQIGVVGILFATLGAFRVLRNREWDWRYALGISAICVVAGGFAFTCVVPSGIGGRYLAPLVPALVVLAYLGAESVVTWQAPTTRVLVLALCFLAVIGVECEFSSTSSGGMNAAANVIFAAPEDNAFILVGSTVEGEGAITAEIAARDRRHERYVVRGFGVLGSGDFMGTDYRSRFTTSNELAQWIERHGIGWVIIDTSPKSLAFAHNAQLLQIAQSSPDAWKLVGQFPILNGETLLYEVSVPVKSIDHTELLSELRPARMIGR